MQNVLQAVTIIVWVLIGLLLVVGTREVIKLKPRAKVRSYARREVGHVFAKEVPLHIRENFKVTHFEKSIRIEHVEERPLVKCMMVMHKRSPFVKRCGGTYARRERSRATSIQRPGSPDWMKKHDEVLSLDGGIS